MAGRIDARLKELKLELPEPTAPTVAKIVNAVLANGFLYVSGQVPRVGGKISFVGKVGREFDLAKAQEAAKWSVLNVLGCARHALGGDLDRIERVVKLTGYVNAMPTFTEIPQVVNGGSQVMIDVFGETGHHARTAVGVAVMPFDVAIEVEAVFQVK